MFESVMPVVIIQMFANCVFYIKWCIETGNANSSTFQQMIIQLIVMSVISRSVEPCCNAPTRAQALSATPGSGSGQRSG